MSVRRHPSLIPSASAAVIATAIALAMIGGCASPSRSPEDWLAIREVTPEFLLHDAAYDPALAADDHGRVALTYVTRDSAGKNLWLALSRDSGVTFSAPVRINLRDGGVRSFPENRPLAAFGPRGELAVAWSEQNGDSATETDLIVRASRDAGASLGAPVVVNDERAQLARHPLDWPWLWRHRWRAAVFHGFPAVAYLPDGSLFATWLDERENPVSEDEPSVSSLYAARSEDGGLSWSENARVASSVCPCCRPRVATDASGRIAIGYRRGLDDLRDPAVTISRDGGRSFALDTLLSPDRWRLSGCPDQGPGLTWNRGGGGLYGWYTGADPAGVYVISWNADRGPEGVKRPILDSLLEARSPRLAAMGEATLIGVEARSAADSSHTRFAVRMLAPSGTLSPWVFLGAEAEAGWLASVDSRTALACWMERRGEQGRLRIARLKVRSID
jgi:hypothetical protein